MSEDFGGYRLVEKIGGGSLGEVFRAQGSQAESPDLALKRLARAHLENRELAAVLIREAELASKMSHERLVGALDHGSVEGWPFLVTRLMAEGSLEERLAPALPPAELAQFARELGEALSAMHTLGFTHCDLGPGNILFHEGRAHIADFSAATPMGQTQPQPQGTFAFMSPEQVQGKALAESSDVFAAASLLWLCTTGERIFSRSATHLCFMAVVEEEAPAMAPELAGIEAVLRPALHKEPGKRCQSIAELCESFAAAASALPES